MSDIPKLSPEERQRLFTCYVAMKENIKDVAAINRIMRHRDNRIFAAEQQLDNAVYNLELYLGLRDDD
jgi:hypothetical protein